MNDLFHPDDVTLYENLPNKMTLTTKVEKLRSAACAFMIRQLRCNKKQVSLVQMLVMFPF